MQEDNLPRVKVNLKRMLDARKINGNDEDIIVDVPGILWANKRGDDWLVLCVEDINKKIITALFTYCTPENKPAIPHCIIVYRTKCTPTASKEMLAFPATKIEQFKMDEIIVCPIESKIVPIYTLLSGDEAAVVRQKYGSTRLSKILTTDPVQRYYHANIGDIYMTVARFGALQPEIKYRVVCAPTN